MNRDAQRHLPGSNNIQVRETGILPDHGGHDLGIGGSHAEALSKDSAELWGSVACGLHRHPRRRSYPQKIQCMRMACTYGSQVFGDSTSYAPQRCDASGRPGPGPIPSGIPPHPPRAAPAESARNGISPGPGPCPGIATASRSDQETAGSTVGPQIRRFVFSRHDLPAGASLAGRAGLAGSQSCSRDPALASSLEAVATEGRMGTHWKWTRVSSAAMHMGTLLAQGHSARPSSAWWWAGSPDWVPHAWQVLETDMAAGLRSPRHAKGHSTGIQTATAWPAAVFPLPMRERKR